MVLLPKLRQQIMVSAAQAFRARHIFYMHIAARKLSETQAAWAEIATRPIRRRSSILNRATIRDRKIPHSRLVFGIACLLLLLTLLLTQPTGTGSAPYLTYDKVSSFQAAPVSIETPQPNGLAPCSMLTVALDLCTP